MNEKKAFVEVELEVICFDTEDVIVTSGESKPAKDPYELPED